MRYFKKKIRDIIISPQVRKEVLFVIGLYLLSILVTFIIICLIYAAEYGW